MALPFNITLLSPLVVITGGGSTQTLTFSGAEVQFGQVQQIYDGCVTVSVNQYVSFELKKGEPFTDTNQNLYYLVSDKDILFIEAPPM